MMRKRTRVFVSQPMAGRSNCAIERERQDLFDWILAGLGLDDPIEIPLLSEYDQCRLGPVGCLGRSVQDLAIADVVVFMPGWNNARGCRIEHEICDMYGLRYVELVKCGEGYSIAYDMREKAGD